MLATIITIGSEILSGDILNSNAKYFSLELNELGFKVDRHLSIDDNFDTIVKTVRDEALGQRLILTTGGLGPTKDDITKEAVCQALDEDLVLNQASKDRLVKNFSDRPDALENNMDQAYFPRDAQILINTHGTADGFFLDKKGLLVMVLPGPPRENKPMFEKYGRIHLEGRSRHRLESRYYRIVDLGEWETEKTIRDLIEGPDTIATFARTEGLFIKVSLDEDHYKDLDSRFTYYEDILKERFSEKLVSQSLQPPEELLASLLLEEKISVSTGESITGGLIASKIISVPGISSCIEEAYVTYSNEAKHKILNVSHETMDKHDVVSQETITEMLEGLKEVTRSDLLIASSGYAGPGPGAGKVYYGAYYKGKMKIVRKDYRGTRNEIRARTANDAIINAYILIMDQKNQDMI